MREAYFFVLSGATVRFRLMILMALFRENSTEDRVKIQVLTRRSFAISSSQMTTNEDERGLWRKRFDFLESLLLPGRRSQ